MFTKINNIDLEAYRFPVIDKLGFKTFVTGRAGGVSSAPYSSLNIGDNQGDDPADVKRNMARIKEATGQDNLWAPRQVHGSDIVFIDKDIPEEIIEADAVVTNRNDVTIFVRTADCLPLVLVDPVTRSKAVAHAGRKGTELGIASMVVEFMKANLGVEPANIVAGIGPCIRTCCYEVEEEMAKNFVSCCGLDWEGRMIDIAKANIDQLIGAGMTRENIHDSKVCTSCENDRFYSYRKDGGATGRFMTALS